MNKRQHEIDFFTATADDLVACGWGRWDETSGLYLCPATQFHALPDGIALWSISGTVHVKGRDRIDDDTRGGMLAYGIIPGRTTTDATAIQVATADAQRTAEFIVLLASVCRANGLYDLATGRWLHGDEAAQAIQDMHVHGKV